MSMKPTLWKVYLFSKYLEQILDLEGFVWHNQSSSSVFKKMTLFAYTPFSLLNAETRRLDARKKKCTRQITPPCLNFVLKTAKQHLWAKCYLDFLGSKHYLPQTLNVLNEFTYS